MTLCNWNLIPTTADRNSDDHFYEMFARGAQAMHLSSSSTASEEPQSQPATLSTLSAPKTESSEPRLVLHVDDGHYGSEEHHISTAEYIDTGWLYNETELRYLSISIRDLYFRFSFIIYYYL